MRPFGRDAELDVIDEHFASDARAIVITGTAGVGKSTVLRALGREEGADVISLRAVRDLRGRLAEAFGLAPSATTESALLAAAAARPGHLLLLDDAEDLDEEARALVDRILDASPSLRVVVASRVALRLRDERIVRLEPFGEATSVELLLELARRAAPGHTVADMESVRVLARALGGLPLAIELAARRLPLMGAAALLEHVERHGAVDAPILRRAIESAVATLPPELDCVFARLGRLAGTFDLALVDRISDGRGVATIEALHDRSLLRVEPGRERPRYALYDSAREVALERGADDDGLATIIAEHGTALAAASRAGAISAHDDLLALARDLEGVSRRALEQGRTELAARAAIALEPVCASVHGYPMLLDDVEAASRGDRALHARVLVVRGRAWFFVGALDRGLLDMEAALEEATDPFVEGLAATKAAIVRVQMGEDASALFERAEAAVGRANDPWLLAAFRRDRALAWMREGRDEDAQRLLEEALTTEDRFGGEVRALLHGTLAQLHQNRGELEPAVARFTRSIECARAAGESTLGAWGLATLGSVEIELGRLDDARHHLDAALRIATEVQAAAIGAVCLVGLAQLAHETGDLPRAVVSYHRALPALLRVKQQRGAALTLAACASAEASLGRAELSHGRMAEARRQLTSARPGDSVALDVFDAIVRVESAKHGAGDLAEAQSFASEVIARAKGAKSSDELRMALRLLGVAIARSKPPPPATAVDVRIGSEAAWIETSSGRAHLPPRSPLRRVLLFLAKSRLERPGETVSIADVFAAAWSERALPGAAANRVKVAINTLRRAGLKDALETVGRGYRLSPEMSLLLED